MMMMMMMVVMLMKKRKDRGTVLGEILPLSMSWRMEKRTALDFWLLSSFRVVMERVSSSEIAREIGGSRAPQIGLMFTWLEEAVVRIRGEEWQE